MTTRELLGAELSRARQLAGVTGRQMAAAIGISQAKLSRVENGQAILSLPEVKAWCAAVAANEATTARVVRLVELAFTESLPWRGALDVGRTHLQDFAHEIESSASTIRSCVTNLVPGLLQTAGYARALFPIVTAGLTEHDHEAAVSGRLRRQEILYDQAHQFDFLITESALRWRPGSPGLMAAQLTKIMNVATLQNVNIRILTFGSQTGPWESFTLYDDMAERDATVSVELPHARLALNDPRDVKEYRDRYARWSERALADQAALGWLGQLARDLDSPDR